MSKTTLGHAGRVVIPKSVRDKHHLVLGDTFEVESEGEKIVLRPVHEAGTMRKEKGMWVFYSGSGKKITQSETDAVLRDLRDERDMKNLGK
jgi:AbrB family looped-hinge helix DNA binding protein